MRIGRYRIVVRFIGQFTWPPQRRQSRYWRLYVIYVLWWAITFDL